MTVRLIFGGGLQYNSSDGVRAVLGHNALGSPHESNQNPQVTGQRWLETTFAGGGTVEEVHIPGSTVGRLPSNGSRTWLACYQDRIQEDTVYCEVNLSSGTTETQKGQALCALYLDAISRELRVYGLMNYSVDGDSGTTSAAVTVTATTLTDTRKAWTVDQWVGRWVVCGGEKLLVTSNTSTVLTGSGGWVDSTPATGQAYTIQSSGYPKYRYKVFDSSSVLCAIGQARTGARVNTTPDVLDFQWVASTTPSGNTVKLYVNGSVDSGINDAMTGDAGTANAAVTTTNTTLTDTRESWTVDQWVGLVVTCNGKTMTVTSNTATTLTGVAWSGGGNPGNGNAWTLASQATVNPATGEPHLLIGCATRGSKGSFAAHGDHQFAGGMYDNLTDSGSDGRWDTFPIYSSAPPAFGAGSNRPLVTYRQPATGRTSKHDSWAKSAGSDAAALLDEIRDVDDSDLITETVVNDKQSVDLEDLRYCDIPIYPWDTIGAIQSIGKGYGSDAAADIKVFLCNASADAYPITYAMGTERIGLVTCSVLDPSGAALTFLNTEATALGFEAMEAGPGVTHRVYAAGMLILFTQGTVPTQRPQPLMLVSDPTAHLVGAANI